MPQMTNEQIIDICLSSEWRFFKNDPNSLMLYIEGMLSIQYALNDQFANDLILDIEFCYQIIADM